jgi:DNA-binding MarR family transcriptional regulator
MANDDDRRAFVIRLTDKSREIFPQMLEVGDTVADDGLRGFTPDERETLVRLLGRVRRNLIDCGGE